MKHYDLKLDKNFVYMLVIIFLLVFALFFMSKAFDISPISFTVKESDKGEAASDFFDNLDGKYQELADEATEKVKNSILP